ncbi:efflux RND transporter permease subunit [Sulfurovum mangrovi]|uniref:efflux RND transporter permease subunit n=1 Tax=Sulfurovum mangrovi TaxID=2893889 RepID=UPI001E5C860E|nr:CusA/CzcA family heavy metal efflux RND transporter [Sulfurovum mangrovi]UFH59572.1 CusA/CzcA family heavy metal efflux RND transporter [Sulfurovum mangrovi]UFH60712.1 CusA/CzcA family heavy metal efflux RND transporter [Sulfurovum mangrovi]
MNRVIGFALSQRLFFTLLAVVILGFGVKAYKELPIDAFPDISPTQVKIILKSGGMTPEEIESRIAIPVEMKMVGIPHQSIMRSLSKYGLCDITIDFEDGTDIYWARQQVSERLADIKEELPENIEGGLAPISTPLSDILMFTIESEKLSLTEKRTLLDWIIAPKIRSISGVAEVNALGGKVKTYEVVPDLVKMRALGITVQQLFDALESNNQNDGAGRVASGVESIFVRSVGKLSTILSIQTLPLARQGERVITVADVAKVRIGYLTRSGFVTKNGESEAVQGLVLGLKGANTAHVLDKVKAELKQIEPMLPEDVKVDIFYDRSDLVTLATDTVKSALFEAVILIIVILLLMLGNFASAISVALILPFALMMSFIAMQYFGLTANLMSLGGLAIAIGILVDSAVVMVEHITAELGNTTHKQQNKIHIIYHAAVEMAPSIITGVLIIIIVFMPLLSLEGLEGKLFKPVALSIIFALFSSLILALTIIPVLSSFILKIRPDKESFLVKFLLKKYRASLIFAIGHARMVMVSVLIVFITSLYLASKTGKTFMPTMDEGSIIIGVEMLPSISLEESKRLNLKVQKRLLASVPEIKNIIARTGSDELGLDPMSLNDTDTFLVLKPKEEWREPSKAFVIEEIRKVLDAFVGIEYGFTQPIEMRVSEMLTGVRGDLAIDIFGSDNSELEHIAVQVKKILESTPGSRDVYKKANEGVEFFELGFNRKVMGYHGITQKELNSFLQVMLTGKSVGIIQEGMRRIGLMVKGDGSLQHSLEKIQRLHYPLEDGTAIPLSQLVEFKSTTGPVQIEHENGYRKTVVQSNVEGRDLVSFVEDVKKRVEEEVKLPAGYYLSYGGEFENQQRAASRLGIIVPIALFLIFILLFVSFGSLLQATIVLVNVPLALIGGFAGLYFSGEYLSVPASVGFIALLGIAVLNGVVLVNYFNYLLKNGYTLMDTVIEGSVKRLRPVLMTASIAAFGLIPLLFATGPGSEIQRPLAIVVINGLISSTVLTLIVLPILYLKFVKEQER